MTRAPMTRERERGETDVTERRIGGEFVRREMRNFRTGCLFEISPRSLEERIRRTLAEIVLRVGKWHSRLQKTEKRHERLANLSIQLSMRSSPREGMRGSDGGAAGEGRRGDVRYFVFFFVYISSVFQRANDHIFLRIVHKSVVLLCPLVCSAR